MLKDLLIRDESAESSLRSIALTEVLGDQYLLGSNRIFRSIRNETLGLNFRFSNSRNELYESFPFAQLETIFSEKVIPTVHNRKAVEQIAERVPSASWLDIADGFRRCLAFHESCHVVARFRLESAIKIPQDPEQIVLLRMLEESFANTCELFAVMDCKDLTDLALYEANAYTALWEAKELFRSLDIDANVLLFTLLHYLRANYLRPNSDLNFSSEERDIEDIYEIANIQQGHTLNDVAAICYTLDENFRHTTSRLFLRLNRLPEDLENRSPIEQLQNNPQLIDHLKELCGLVLDKSCHA